MAVNVTPLNSKLQMRFQVGLNDDGSLLSEARLLVD